MKRSISIIIAGQPSTNPRATKEAITFSQAGYTVTVIYNYWVQWAEKEDEKLKTQYPAINWIEVGGQPTKNKWLYIFTRLRHKIFRYLVSFYPHCGIFWQERTEARCFPELRRHAFQTQADIYIAHNLGALPVAAQAAKKNKSIYAFDAEDYHRGQVSEESIEYKRVVKLEDNYLPGAAYCTAASPLIAAHYKEHYPFLNPIVINNVFSKQYLQNHTAPFCKGDVLRLFWFSQTVGTGRGIEEVIQAMGRLKDLPIAFTILGSCLPAMKLGLLDLAKEAGVNEQHLHFLEPVPLAAIFQIAAQHHIGLALEMGFNKNNNIALSNKLFIYLLSGLAIITTNTKAQTLFIRNHPEVGVHYSLEDISALASLLEHWYHYPGLLEKVRANASQLAAESLNWEKEQVALLEKVKSLLFRG